MCSIGGLCMAIAGRTSRYGHGGCDITLVPGFCTMTCRRNLNLSFRDNLLEYPQLFQAGEWHGKSAGGAAFQASCK